MCPEQQRNPEITEREGSDRATDRNPVRRPSTDASRPGAWRSRPPAPPSLRFGDTMVLAAVTVSPNISTLPFFPLTVEYREKTYAAGKIPGGFLKREGRPSDNEILASRLIDRSIRPLFPEGLQERSAGLRHRALRRPGERRRHPRRRRRRRPRSACRRCRGTARSPRVRVGRVEGNWILNPTFQQLEFSTIDLVVERLGRLDRDGRGRRARGLRGRGARGAQGRAEGHPRAHRPPEAADRQGRRAAEDAWTKAEVDPALAGQGRARRPRRRWRRRSTPKDKASRAPAASSGVKEQVAAELLRRVPRQGQGDRQRARGRSSTASCASRCWRRASGSTAATSTRSGRSPSRPACCRAPTARRCSPRGQTQALVAVTLGTADDEQRIDSIDVAGETTKSFMLHYNFPPFSTGEVQDDPRHQPPRDRARQRWPSARCRRCCRTSRSSPTRSASSPRSSSPTARRRWPRSAAARSR